MSLYISSSAVRNVITMRTPGIGNRKKVFNDFIGKGKNQMLESELNNQLKKVKNYAGSFARNEVKEIDIKTLPFFMIINLDKRESKGTHLIAVAIYQNDFIFM